MQQFSPEDLTRYLYNEMTPTEAADLEAAVANDWTLHEKLQVIAAAVNRLDKTPLLSPSTKSIEALLTYADNTTNVKL